MAGRSRPTTPSCGVPSGQPPALALPLPIAVICELLGVPYDDRAAFRAWTQAAGDITDRARSEQGLAELYGYGQQPVAAKRREGLADGDDADVITRLAATEGVSDDEAAMMEMFLLFAGHETTVVAIGTGVLWLLANPGQRQAMVTDPSRIDAAVEEILRAPGLGGGGIPRYARTDARSWPWMRRALERGGMAEHRQALLADLSGQVIEIGAGDGANFAHYPVAVTRVLAVEPEPRLRDRATAAAAAAPVPVEVSDGLAERLPAADASMDAAVFCLVLCSLPDVDTALAEARRVLKPGGRLRFLEHGPADSAGMVRVQRLLDATFRPRLMGGCHTGRDTVAAIERAGLTIAALDHYLFPPVLEAQHGARPAGRRDPAGKERRAERLGVEHDVQPVRQIAAGVLGRIRVELELQPEPGVEAHRRLHVGDHDVDRVQRWIHDLPHLRPVSVPRLGDQAPPFRCLRPAHAGLVHRPLPGRRSANRSTRHRRENSFGDTSAAQIFRCREGAAAQEADGVELQPPRLKGQRTYRSAWDAHIVAHPSRPGRTCVIEAAKGMYV